MNFGFVDGIYNSSSISLDGLDSASVPIREIAVVGGTGVFRFARVYAIAKTYSFDHTTGDAIVRYNRPSQATGARHHDHCKSAPPLIIGVRCSYAVICKVDKVAESFMSKSAEYRFMSNIFLKKDREELLPILTMAKLLYQIFHAYNFGTKFDIAIIMHGR
ncbi:hypothetical protein ACSBR2_019582 [Camellia fascicularis]